MAAPSPLIITQILAPKRRPNLLHRPRLVDFIHGHIDRKLLLVSASAGYGKTSLLIDYAHDTDLPVCWLSVTESARDPRVFLDHLIASINHHFPEFGQRSRTLLQTGETLSDPTLFVGTLVNEIFETIPDYFVIVIDDYHIVDSSQAVNLVLDTLIQHLPDNCHFVISSRTVPTLSPRGLALLTARQEIAGLGVNDLRFTPEEIQELFLQSYGQRLPDEAARELAEKSEGWITGILLTTHTMWKGLFEGIIRIQGSDSTVYDYLVNEVFSQQPPTVRDFLLSTAILEEMSPLLCDELLGVSTSRERLSQLEQDNLFVIRLEKGEDRWYRYHHLFREFLLTKLQEREPEEIQALHLRAAGLLRASNAAEKAIPQYLAGKDHNSAMAVILEIARETYDAGKLGTLASWIDALPTDLVSRRARLLWFRAKTYAELGELDPAAALFDRAYAEFSESGDHMGQAQALVEKSAVLRFQGEFRQAIDACKQAILLVQGASEQNGGLQVTASAHRQIGTCLARLGNLSEGEEELRRALGMYEQMDYATNIAHVHNDLGVILRLAGNLAGSELHFRRALEIWEEIGNVGMVALTINNVAVGHYYRGEYAEALQLYEVGLAQARKAGLDRPMAFILAGMGDIYRDQRAYSEALKAYEEGLQAARQSREAYIIRYLLDATGNTHRLMGNDVLAIDLVRQAYERARERNASFEMGLYQISLGAISYQQGNTGQAKEYLSRARDILAQSDAKGELAKASLYLAQAHYVAGEFQEALHCTQTVLDCLLGLGYHQFLLPVARETKPVLEYAWGKGLGQVLIGHLLRQLETDALTTPDPRVSMHKEPGVVQPLLRASALGESRVLRGDELVTNAEWGMAKSKELLFYLMCHKQRRKDQIGNDLWPDLSPAKLRSSFHVALYRLRRALAQQECVVYEDDKYFFNRRINYWFDVEEFQAAITGAESARATDKAEAARYYADALLLYQGDFLDDFSLDHDWCRFQRESLLQKYLGALWYLGEYHAANGDHEQALGFYERLVEKDSYQESAHREILRCHALLGERSVALKSYHHLAEFLESELGVPPAPETTALYEQILRGEVAPD